MKKLRLVEISPKAVNSRTGNTLLPCYLLQVASRRGSTGKRTGGEYDVVLGGVEEEILGRFVADATVCA
jgi:hypothetical protein